MTHVYERLGIRPVINALGPATRVSGSIMPLEVADAMREASQYCVDITSLQARASQIIAGHTGAEAGYVTCGAAAGLLLATAACVTGLDPTKMNRLPDTKGMKNRVVMARSHRNFYDHAVRSVGIELVEVGIADRYSGAGVRDAEPWEYTAAIDEDTAAVFYVAYTHTQPDLPAVVEVAHAAGVPVIVDAAGQLPPASNLRRFIDEGADLVAFSGGKAIRGPQASGILCGRRELIEAVALQHLDLDILWDQWNPPIELIDKRHLPGAPHHGIGRPCKVGKEEIVGLLTALEIFVNEDPAARRQAWLELMQQLLAAAGDIPHIELSLVNDPKRSQVPVIHALIDEEACGMSALDIIRQLQDSDPSIQANPTHVREGKVAFGPMCLKPGEPEIVGRRLREILGV
ncbi:MAG: aminotransferase class V-fold PLP-dependent enzyme [Gemmatimonadetes bacterium]|jgi:D-glucosaminate-6-phosphate ammonia-lyase|nr:aminotransferase class V-fold PLP-dependent enzyme [Gemmatimonadota bacterium]MBT6146802.1 aminotransferase class V-fold PLP-dependent enzyme [Gemmatimonadota bacterium]MBT7862939.1 aminotransferase class V-fold PLP-dependent enzyme [Gemmatimonadota bacterium]